MTLTEAREAYKDGKITFKKLDEIWRELADQKEKNEFYSAPVFDRPWVVEGKTQAERDAKWGQFLQNIPEG